VGLAGARVIGEHEPQPRLRQHVPIHRRDLVRQAADPGQADREVRIMGVGERDPVGLHEVEEIAASDERRDFVRSYLVRLGEAGELPAEGEADLRYAGQSFELTVPLGPEVATAFHRAHEERYGYADPSRPIELVAVRTAEVTSGPTIERRPTPLTEVSGPDVLELDTATCWLPPGWVGVRDGKGAGWRLTRS